MAALGTNLTFLIEPSDNLVMTERERERAAWILHENEVQVIPYAISHNCSVNEAIEKLYADRIQQIGGA